MVKIKAEGRLGLFCSQSNGGRWTEGIGSEMEIIGGSSGGIDGSSTRGVVGDVMWEMRWFSQWCIGCNSW